MLAPCLRQTFQFNVRGRIGYHPHRSTPRPNGFVAIMGLNGVHFCQIERKEALR